jgi:adenylate cyclase
LAAQLQIEEGGDVDGEGVEIAAHLKIWQSRASILISGKIQSEVEGKVEATFEDRSEQPVMNISKPVCIFAVRLAGTALTPQKPVCDVRDVKILELPDKPSIVLPFQNMSGESGAGVFRSWYG